VNKDRELFISRFEKNATKNNYLKSFNKLDDFLSYKNMSEDMFLNQLRSLEMFKKYEVLQELVNIIKKDVSPRVTKLYFDSLFKYFLIIGIPLDYTQKRIRIQFPRIVNKRFEGLDKIGINKLLRIAQKPNENNNVGGRESFAMYMKTLIGSGMRETEGLKITPSMIHFEEFPTRLDLPGTITKYSIPRETFLPTKTSNELRDLIEKKKVNQHETIFTKNWTERTLVDYEVYFENIREKAGLATPNRVKYQQNDITLHSFRAYFITTFTDHNQDSFGHALAGHTKDLTVYFRKSLKDRQIIYASVMKDLEF